MRRREFLKLGSASVAVLALPDLGVLNPEASATAARAAILPRLSVAYAAPLNSANGAARLIAAEQLPTGEARLARDGARVTLAGVVPADSALRAANVQFSFQPYHATPFQAWSHLNGTSAKPVSFIAPVDAAVGLNLWLDLANGDAQSLSTVVRLALDDEAGVPKLASGTYVIALDDAAGSLSRYRLATAGTNALGLFRASLGGHTPASHAHLLMTIA